jgi:cytochrome d ubiquinol oxidase subunit I
MLALDLARAQFAFTMSFHIVFPAFSIGLASYLAVLNLAHLVTGRRVFLDAFDYWKRIFAVAFGMGVVSGIVMSYQFGANWSVYSDKVGPVLGPLMGYEVMTAFFLEAGFLGVMLFGREKVGPGLHAFATCMVGFGTFVSAFWILAVNSWMQTPAGYGVNAQGQFIPEHWLAVIFNPSFPYRLVHMTLAAYLTTAFVVGAVGAFHLLRGEKAPVAKLMFSMAMAMATVVAPIQIEAGDQHGLNTLKYQPAKIAALEGDFDTLSPTPLILFGIPDMKTGVTRDEISIPYLGSLILTHTLTGAVRGLKSFAVTERPDSLPMFFAFRIMVGIGFAMAGLGLWSLWLRWRGGLYTNRWLLRAAVVMGPSGFIAVLAGWVVTETGRQPYTVYGLLRTADSVSPVAAPAVGTSLVAFALVYFIIFVAGVLYILRLMADSPDSLQTPVEGPIRAAGPPAALDEVLGQWP